MINISQLVHTVQSKMYLIISLVISTRYLTQSNKCHIPEILRRQNGS